MEKVNIVRITTCDRDMQANAGEKMVPVDLLDSGLPQIFNL